MMLYWADVRPWLFRGLTALGIVAAGGFGTIVAGASFWVGVAFGGGYYLFTRLIVWALRNVARPRDDAEARVLWRQLRHFIGHLRHGTWMVSDEDELLFQAMRRTGRGILRYRWDDAELIPSGNGVCTGTVPIELFIASSNGRLYRVREIVLFQHDSDGMVAFHDGRSPDQRGGSADLKKTLSLEHRAGMLDVDSGEVKELLDQLLKVRAVRGPAHVGCQSYDEHT